MQAYIVAVIILIVAAACDYKTRRIPNLIIIAGYITAFATMLLLNEEEFYIYFIRALWPIPALFIFYFLKALGAGDIKLFSVVSIFCPTYFFIRFIVISFVVSAVWGIVKLLIHKELHIKMMSVIGHIKECVQTKDYSHYIPKTESSYICFSVCMLVAFLINIGMEVFF